MQWAVRCNGRFYWQKQLAYPIHCKKVIVFPIFSQDVTNPPWPGSIKLFPARESLVSDIQLGTGKIITFFYSVRALEQQEAYQKAPKSVSNSIAHLSPSLTELLMTCVGVPPTDENVEKKSQCPENFANCNNKLTFDGHILPRDEAKHETIHSFLLQCTLMTKLFFELNITLNIYTFL